MNRKRYLAGVAGMLLAACLLVSPLRSGARKPPQYSSPDVATASSIAYPVDTLAAGAVTLLLNLDGGAHVQNTSILRDFPPLTVAVQSAVQNWTFTPASLDGKPVSSSITVTVIFNIFNPGGGAAFQSLSLAPAQSPAPDASQYVPPLINSASFANYPENSVAKGTVVLDVTIGAGGQPRNIRVVRAAPTLTQQAINSVKTWSFNPATIKNEPIATHIVVAFVFQRNMG